MAKTITIKCLNNNSELELSRGVSVAKVAEIAGVTLPNPILGALVNNRIRDLGYELFHPKTIKFFDITHPDGMRMYIRSLSFVLYAALKELFRVLH